MRSEIKSLLEKHELTRIEKQLEKHILPCVAFDVSAGHDSLPVGASKLGGNPDLPNDFGWFENNGRPLDFLLQINLAEASKLDTGGLLPNHGLLSFFYDLEEQPWGYDPKQLAGSRVLYSPMIDNLTAREVPNSEYKLTELEINFKSGLTIPSTSSPDYESFDKEVGLTSEEFDDFWNFFHEFSEKYSVFNSDSRSHRLLGHSKNVQGDMQTEAQLVTHGYYCGRPFPNEDPEREKIKKNYSDWILLLQLDSDDKAELMWGDDGMLYFWIRKADLARQNFDNVWTGLQCY